MKNKKTTLAIIGVIAVVLVTIGITYAYWLVTKTQTGSNVITAGCLDITLNGEKNDITLTDQFPLSDEEGAELVPYEFTVTNNCNTAVDYQVNLESIGNSSTALKTTSLKVMLDDGTPSILGYNSEVEPTISGAYASNRLIMGTLQASSADNTNDSVTYSLRLWINADAPISEMNRTYTGKVSVTVGQGINHAIEEGTLAYDIIEENGGLKSITGATHKWVETEFENSTNNSLSSTSKYYWGTDYTFDPEEGKYKLSGKVIQSTVADCRSGVNSCGPYTLKSTSATASSLYLTKITSWTNSEKADSGYSTYVTLQQKTRAIETGLYKTPDDYGESYYFRGEAENNYIQFGTMNDTVVDGLYGCSDSNDSTTCDVTSNYKTIDECNEWIKEYFSDESATCREMYYSKEGEDIYWRIVRINGDGTIRLVYDGNPKDETDNIGFAKTIDGTEYQANDYRFSYLNNDGTITGNDHRRVLETWYAKHLNENYRNYIVDSIFCNDTSHSEQSQYYIYDETTGEITPSTKDNYNYANIIFSTFERWKNNTPLLTCMQKQDRMTVENTFGNSLLIYPIGLMTSDELLFAGASMYSKDDYQASGMYDFYLYSKREGIITMSPQTLSDDSGIYINSIVANAEQSAYVYGRGMRPVINLKADVEFTGSGTLADPYVIATN